MTLVLGKPIRELFPYFAAHPESSYLDTAASSQKPKSVIDRLSKYFSSEHANIHRGAYQLSAESTSAYEHMRERVAQFLGTSKSESIIFTRGTTESINLVAHSLEQIFQPGDSILLTLLEHHSNIVPWQLLAKRRNLNIHFAPINLDSTVNTAELLNMARDLKPKLVSITQISNAFGTVVPIEQLVPELKSLGAIVSVDAAQSVGHRKLSVTALNADFVSFSMHKIYGPTGVGVLYVAPHMYQQMEPFLGGGGMISNVTIQGSEWIDPPHKFEAGTPPIAEVISSGPALDLIDSIGIEKISQHERALSEKAREALLKEKDVLVHGPDDESARSSIVAFNLRGVHSHDLSTVVDTFNVQIRAGHHCAMPAHEKLGIKASARASFAVYSSEEDIAKLIEGVRHARKILG